MCKMTGAEGDRTLNLRIANATLSQLSYGPNGFGKYTNRRDNCEAVFKVFTGIADFLAIFTGQSWGFAGKPRGVLKFLCDWQDFYRNLALLSGV